MISQFFIKPTGNIIARVVRNKQTSGAAVVFLGAKYGAQLGTVWLPGHAEQFKQTADILESLAVGYGLLAAGDSNPTPPTSTLDGKADPTKGA